MYQFRRALVLGLVCLGVACGKTSPAEHTKRGDAFLAEKKFSEAIVEYRTALQQDAQLGDARLKLAGVYAQLGDVQNAYREYIRAADSLPDNTDAQLKGGAMLLLANRFAEAKSRAESVLRREPRNAEALVLLGNALAGLKDETGALERLNQAIAVDPESGLAYSNLGALQLARGDRQLAEASFKKAITANPTSMNARVALANYYRAQSRTADAETTLVEAGRLDPQNVQVNSNLVELYLLTGRPSEAEAPLKAIVAVMQNAEAEFTLAEYYVRVGRQAEAVPILKKLSGTTDSSGLAKVRLAAIDYKEGRQTDAHKALDEILGREPDNRAALMLKGQLLSIEQKFGPALGFLKSAAAADPARAGEPTLVIAKIYQVQGQLEEAQDAYKQVLTSDPSSLPAQLALSRLSAVRGDPRSAAQFARGAVTTAPTNAEAHLTLVRALVAVGDFMEAEKELKLLHENLPPSAAVEVEAGLLYLSRNQRAAAQAAFDKALALNPQSLEGLAGLVDLDLEKKDRAAATGRLEARLKATPQDGHGWYLASQAYFGLKDWTKAEQALQKTIQLDPSNFRAFAMLGAVYGVLGRIDEAEKEFEKWAAREPRSVAAHTMVALLLERQGKRQEALKKYEILELDPRAVVASNNLAWIYGESGTNLDVALQLAQGAASQVPNEPNFNDTVGWIYYQKDLPDSATESLRKAVERDAANPLFRFHLGMALAKRGEDAQAIDSLKRALALNGQFEEADKARSMLKLLEIPQ